MGSIPQIQRPCESAMSEWRRGQAASAPTQDIRPPQKTVTASYRESSDEIDAAMAFGLGSMLF